MTGLWFSLEETELLAVARAMPCPRCGTSTAVCRVWAGGPGHVPGIHPARIEAAREARSEQRRSADADLNHRTIQTDSVLGAATQNGHLVRTLAGNEHNVSAA